MNGIWDPKKLNVNCNGREVSGLSQADGFFKIEPVTKEYIMSQVGIKGDWNISEVYDGRVKLSIVLMGDSPENEFFFAMGEGRLPCVFTMKDKSDGGMLGFSAQGRVWERPTIERGKEYKDRTWVFLLPDYKGVLTA
ncbi:MULTISPECIES: phage structural protein [Leptospira]|uniref:Uncharacterized protein n=1 Tax=Leptospira kirschneri str. 200802841 TaxID=1193047 RepID=A0A828Y0Y9_9LEPT|nr:MULTISPECIES: hypothetical protein [Leptospira]EKO51387.1 hypothetical protein LEP1GSC131_2023 [Leptospira kirschneri str. 200802841]EMO73911.1 hypothetical protein LEP1GSC127_2965 [Leptospira kirschneri str. 200801925]